MRWYYYATVSYPPQGQAPYVAAPPPMGYPSKEGYPQQQQQQRIPEETTSRGDGFWKGW